ncbi:MAG: hypothetical protein BMS9Abin37_0090 [Acidobacteriota bacterium]|nr:MAG: hypothetical protein BMS9Abin37_0090 [Acidobacteriota bacterium]
MRYILLFAIGLLSCVTHEVPRSERIVVDIAGDAVTVGEFDRFVATSVHQEEPFVAADVLEALFEQFIEEKLLLRAAEDAGVRADPESVARRLEVVEKSQMAKSQVSSRTAIAAILERQLVIEKLIETELFDGLEVTDAEVEAHFEANRALYERPETVSISQILVEDEPEAKEILQQLKANPALFEKLAEEHSQGPESSRSGLLGTFGRGELPLSFESVVFALRKGRISDVVATDFGFHIFKLHKKTDAGPLSLDDVRDTIRVELLRDKSETELSRYIEKLKQTYAVSIHREHLSFAFLGWEDANAAGVPTEESP